MTSSSEQTTALIAELRRAADKKRADLALQSAALFTRAADALEAATVDAEWEYGTEYEVSSTHTEFTPAHSREHAERWVADSPTDTGLVRRLIGAWRPVGGTE